MRHALRRQHAGVVVLQDLLRRAAHRADGAARPAADDHQRDRQRHLREQQLRSQPHAVVSSSSNETMCRSKPLASRTQPQRHRAPEDLPPPGLLRAADDDVARRRASARSRAAHATGIVALQPHHLGAQLARALRCWRAGALRLGVDAVRRLLGRLDVDDEPVGRQPPGHAAAAPEQRRRVRRIRGHAHHDAPARRRPARPRARRPRLRAVERLGHLAQRQLAQRREVLLLEEVLSAATLSAVDLAGASRSSRSSTARSRFTIWSACLRGVGHGLADLHLARPRR